MEAWRAALNSDPLPWLLERDTPAMRQQALRGLAWIPPRRRSRLVRRGFPSGYVADVLQNLEVPAELGHARDPRLTPAVDWVLAQQDANGRWRNRNDYAGKTWGVIERQGAPSKWFTLRACTVLRAALR